MLSKEGIEKELIAIGITPLEIVYYDLTDSTNTRAKEYAKAKYSAKKRCNVEDEYSAKKRCDAEDEYSAKKRPVIFIANGQTSGRGRRGRSFVSENGAGIYLSILTYPEESGFDATAATARAAVCLARAIESLCECEIKIKWVNDLYLGGRKLAGILTEGEMGEDGKIAYQVVGMGINVYKNAISDQISDIATSLEAEGIVSPDRSRLTAMIIKEFLSEGGDFYDEYKSRSFIIGKTVTVMKLSESYEAEVLEVNPDFSLKIQTENGVENLFTGEVSIKMNE